MSTASVQKFNNNGTGVRGDMQAVIKAILLDYEARSTDMVAKPAYGKQREPLLRVAAAGRAFRPDTYGGTYSQSGTRTITIDTTPAGTPHKLASGNNVLLEFTAGSGVAPWTGSYSVTVPTGIRTPSLSRRQIGSTAPTTSRQTPPSAPSPRMVTGCGYGESSVTIDFTSPTAGTLPTDGLFTARHIHQHQHRHLAPTLTIAITGLTQLSARAVS